MAGLWGELLGADRVRVHDDFFRLGGASLPTFQLLTRLRGIFQVDVPLRQLFLAPTVDALAAAILAGELKPGQSEKVARVLLRIKKGAAPAGPPG